MYYPHSSMELRLKQHRLCQEKTTALVNLEFTEKQEKIAEKPDRALRMRKDDAVWNKTITNCDVSNVPRGSILFFNDKMFMLISKDAEKNAGWFRECADDGTLVGELGDKSLFFYEDFRTPTVGRQRDVYYLSQVPQSYQKLNVENKRLRQKQMQPMLTRLRG